MKNFFLILLLWLHVFACNVLTAQEKIGETTTLFSNQEPIFLKLKMSVKNVKKNTNDSTYVESILYYKNEAATYDSLKIDLRARGNNRRENCYYAPLKLKLSKYILMSIAKDNPDTITYNGGIETFEFSIYLDSSKKLSKLDDLLGYDVYVEITYDINE